jgi:hypothetical protein
MTIFKLLACASALVAVPATAQYYPQPTYPQQYQQYPQTYPGYGQGYGQGYGYQQGYGQGYGQNSIGGIIDQLLGNRYNVTDRAAVSRCASAAVAQAQNQYGGGYNQGYGNGYNGQGYNQGYNQNYRGRGYGALRVTAITEVERRSNGLRVSGLLSSGGGGYGGYNQGYGNGGYNGNRQLSFRCNVDYNGAVTGLRIR